MRGLIPFVFGLALLIPTLARAQNRPGEGSEPGWTPRPRLEIVASVAMAHIFRFEDQSFGNHFNFGIGVEAPVWRKLRVGAEINQTLGLAPIAARCGAILSASDKPLPCVGTGRRGVSSASAGSITAAYFFGEGRIQPYLLGGIGILSATEYDTASIIHPDYIEFREIRSHSTGIGPAFGLGLRASLNRHLSVRPEIRFSDGTALSAHNLSQWRISIGAAYCW